MMPDLRTATQDGGTFVVIAEAGVNHNGSEGLAHDLIDVAAASGADYVKFQTFNPSTLVAPDTEATPYQRDRGAVSQSDLLAALALPDEVWPRLRDHARAAGIGFLSTPFDFDSARLLVDMGVDALKLSSGELTNLPLLAAVASLGVPLLVSTGMGTESEVQAASRACAAAPYLAFFHCVSAYPAPVEDCNLRAIPALSAVTSRDVGWSDHTTGTASAVVAAALGARLFEKHFTLDRTMEGPDHAASLEPAELSEYVHRIKEVGVLLGDGVKRRMPSERENAPLVRRSWHVTHDLPAGHMLTQADVIALRPEAGLPPTVDIVGAVTTEPLVAFAPVHSTSLESLQ
jgi:N-acetylneuraminate synthase/N,N'-diacetyllegionaminate synthase